MQSLHKSFLAQDIPKSPESTPSRINGISLILTPPYDFNPPLLSTDLRAPQGKFWRKNPYFLGILWYFLCVSECFEDILQHKISLKLHFRTENPSQSPQNFLACGGLSWNDSSGTNALICSLCFVISTMIKVSFIPPKN